MKKTNVFYPLLIVAICGCLSCGNGGENKGATGSDSTTTNTDSMNSVNHVDPANSYPQPPVTGSNQDSSRSKDSGTVKDTQNRATH